MPKGYFIPFTESDVKYIIENGLKVPTKHIAKKLNVSSPRIHRLLSKHGIYIPKWKRKKWGQIGKFKKGIIPFNKGKKATEYMTKEGILKSSKTRFKKGHKPKNTLYDGAITIRGGHDKEKYKYIRIDNSKWKLLHHVVWEMKNGKIPDGKIIVFKDGDTMNTNIKNLELITRSVNMYRNHYLNYPEEVIPSLDLINQIEQTIKEKQDEK